MVFTGLLSGWSDTQLVPWLEFKDAAGQLAHVNAGILLDYFNDGIPAGIAMHNAVSEINALTFA